MSNNENKISPADLLVELAQEQLELFHTADSQTFAIIDFQGHKECYRVGDATLHLTRIYNEATGMAINKTSLDTAIRLLTARALFDSPCKPVFIRVAPVGDNGIAIDLGDESWKSIEVNRDGWTLGDSQTTVFYREGGMLPLPVPLRDAGLGTLDNLRNLLYLPDEKSWRLVLAWLVMCFMPRGPYPLLEITGPQGSAKSFKSKILVKLADPQKAALQTLPKTEHDGMVTASSCRVIVYDNVSGINQKQSDFLCRVSTGGSMPSRSLYTNNQVSYVVVLNAVIINSINPVSVAQDLISRTIRIEAPPLPNNLRKTERQLDAMFDEAAPGIMGSLMELLSGVIRELPSVHIPAPPRMADFAHVGVAVERVMGWPDGSFRNTYENNLQNMQETGLDNDVVGSAVQAMMEMMETWEGTASDLQKVLATFSHNNHLKTLPQGTQWLSNSLKRQLPALESIGINVQLGLNIGGKRRMIRIVKSRQTGIAAQYPNTTPAIVGNGVDIADSITVRNDSNISQAYATPTTFHQNEIQEMNLNFFRLSN